jgi:NTP pyrophosphatase (non-canonical NTP hydrolase)
LSPASLDFVDEIDGFVFTDGETHDSPAAIEARHVAAIRLADFVWLHAPGGYVGPSAALELGIAHSLDIPVYAAERPSDRALAQFVTEVSTPLDAVAAARRKGVRTPASPLRDLQGYYERVAADRGFDSESAQDAMLLLTEEVGELARAIRQHVGLTRAGAEPGDPGTELADVQLYILHLANITGVDLAGAVVAKEQINHARYGHPS